MNLIAAQSAIKGDSALKVFKTRYKIPGSLKKTVRHYEDEFVKWGRIGNSERKLIQEQGFFPARKMLFAAKSKETVVLAYLHHDEDIHTHLLVGKMEKGEMQSLWAFEIFRDQIHSLDDAIYILNNSRLVNLDLKDLHL